jgi:hypothetical protein
MEEDGVGGGGGVGGACVHVYIGRGETMDGGEGSEV